MRRDVENFPGERRGWLAALGAAGFALLAGRTRGRRWAPDQPVAQAHPAADSSARAKIVVRPAAHSVKRHG